VNDQRPTDPREQMEVRLTALLLGEASAFEEAELLEAIKNDPALAAYYEEMRRMVRQVEATLQTQPMEAATVTPRLSESRRARLEELFQQPASRISKLQATARRTRHLVHLQTVLAVAAAVMILFVVAGMLLPALGKAKSKASRISLLSAGDADDLAAVIPGHDGWSEQTTTGSQARTVKSMPERVNPEFQSPPAAPEVKIDDRFLARYGMSHAGGRSRDRSLASAPPEEPAALARSARIHPPAATGEDEARRSEPGQLSFRADSRVEPQSQTRHFADLAADLPALALKPASKPVIDGDVVAGASVSIGSSVQNFVRSDIEVAESLAKRTADTTAGARFDRLARGENLGLAFQPADQNLIRESLAEVAPQPAAVGEQLKSELTDLKSEASDSEPSALSGPQVAINEAVRRVPDQDQLRVKLADAQSATERGEVTEALRLYDNAIQLADRIGQGVEVEYQTAKQGIVNARAQLAELKRDARDTEWLGLLEDRESGEPVLQTQVFDVDPSTFYQGMEGVFANSAAGGATSMQRAPSFFGFDSVGNANGSLFAQAPTSVLGDTIGGGQPGSGGIRFLTVTNDMSEVNVALRDYLEAMGVNLTVSGMVYYNDRTGRLMVKAPASELDKIQQAVEILNYSPPRDLSESTQSRFDTLALAESGFDSIGGRNSEKSELSEKLATITLRQEAYEGLPLSEVLVRLQDEARRLDPRQEGVDFRMVGQNSPPDFNTDPVTGAPAGASVDVDSAIVNLPASDKMVTLSEALDSIVAAADQPIEYAIENNAIVFKAKGVPIEVEQAPVVQDSEDSVPPPSLEPLPEIRTADNAFSTFSLNVSDVSFQLAASSLENGQMPDGARLRSEEFINAFDYRDPAPAPGQRVAFNWERARNPFAHNRELLRLSVQTAAAGREPGQPLNLVLLLDNSGSMERADRVQITEQMLRVLAAQLTGYDRVSFITFARTPRLIVDGAAGGNPEALLKQVTGLNPDGGTNLEDAMKLAYETAAKHFQANGNNRVILITDGAANLGNVDPAQLRERVIEQRKRGIALDCFGVGWEGYNDNLLESLSRNGDGRYGFLNDAENAPAQFASQLAGALQVAAADVKAQVEFNPNRVTVYRQIGYQQHQLTKEQFRDNTVDAAEIGAAEAGNALYSVEINPNGSGPIGTFRARYRVPSTGLYEEKEWVLDYTPAVPELEKSGPAMRLASTSAAFAEWLANSPYAQTVTPDALQNLLRGVPEVYSPDPRPAKLQAMIQQARAISGR